MTQRATAPRLPLPTPLRLVATPPPYGHAPSARGHAPRLLASSHWPRAVLPRPIHVLAGQARDGGGGASSVGGDLGGAGWRGVSVPCVIMLSKLFYYSVLSTLLWTTSCCFILFLLHVSLVPVRSHLLLELDLKPPRFSWVRFMSEHHLLHVKEDIFAF